jgi:glutamine synthetase adenylyltransferase
MSEQPDRSPIRRRMDFSSVANVLQRNRNSHNTMANRANRESGRQRAAEHILPHILSAFTRRDQENIGIPAGRSRPSQQRRGGI